MLIPKVSFYSDGGKRRVVVEFVKGPVEKPCATMEIMFAKVDMPKAMREVIGWKHPRMPFKCTGFRLASKSRREQVAAEHPGWTVFVLEFSRDRAHRGMTTSNPNGGIAAILIGAAIGLCVAGVAGMLVAILR